MDLSNSGAEVKLIDARSSVGKDLPIKTLDSGVALQMNTAPLKARGFRNVRGLELAKAEDEKWKRGGYEECDLVIISGGWSPTLHLLSHRGIRPIWNDKNACFLAGDHGEPVTMAGSALGIWDHKDCVSSGEASGFCAAEILGKKTIEYSFPNLSGWKNAIKPLYEIKIPNYMLNKFND